MQVSKMYGRMVYRTIYC